jgi:hypothetical protein
MIILDAANDTSKIAQTLNRSHADDRRLPIFGNYGMISGLWKADFLSPTTLTDTSFQN